MAHQYALQARSNCVKINAIQVELEGNTIDAAANAVIRDYQQTTCGWYSDVPHNGVGVADEVDKMLFLPGYCNCP